MVSSHQKTLTDRVSSSTTSVSITMKVYFIGCRPTDAAERNTGRQDGDNKGQNRLELQREDTDTVVDAGQQTEGTD